VTLTVAADRLSRLRLHIQEVSQAVVEHTHTDGRTQRLTVGYLSSLQRQEKDIAAAIAMNAAMTASVDAPVVCRPSF
jgi:hypothetical protein